MSPSHQKNFTALMNSVSVHGLSLQRNEDRRAALLNFTSDIDDRTVRDFISGCGFYCPSNRRWVGRSEMSGPGSHCAQMIGSVVERLIMHFRVTDNRSLVRTSGLKLQHHPSPLGTAYPDLVISGMWGQNLAPAGENADSPALLYQRAVSFIFVHDAQMSLQGESVIGRMNAARQCEVFQGNRSFVWTMAINDTECLLELFDSAGSFSTNRFDYHKDPEAFVRALLVLICPDDSRVGFDTSLSYHRDGRRTIQTLDPNGVVSKITLSQPMPIWTQEFWVAGLGAKLWRLVPPAGTQPHISFYVLECWSPVIDPRVDVFMDILRSLGPNGKVLACDPLKLAKVTKSTDKHRNPRGGYPFPATWPTSRTQNHTQGRPIIRALRRAVIETSNVQGLVAYFINGFETRPGVSDAHDADRRAGLR